MQWRELPLSDGNTLSVGVLEPEAARVTLICVHGWTLDHRSFLNQAPLSAQGIRLVIFDRRGFGANTSPPGLDLEMADVHAVVNHFDTPIVGFGVSQGARVLMRYISQHPDRLAAVLLQGGMVDGLPIDSKEIPIERFAGLVQAGQFDTFKREWLSHPLMCDGVPTHQRAEVASLISRYEGRDLLPGVRMPTPCDLTDALREAPAALAVIEADEETPLRRRHAAFLSEQCGATPIPMPGGHLCHFTHAEAFNAKLMGWLDRLGHGADSGQ